MLVAIGCKPPKLAKPLSPNASFQVHQASTTETAGSEAATAPDGAIVYLTKLPLLTATDVASVKADDTNMPSLQFELTPGGAQKMTSATTGATNLQLGFVIQGKLVSVVKVVSPISGAFQVTGPPISKDLDWAFKALTNP